MDLICVRDFTFDVSGLNGRMRTTRHCQALPSTQIQLVTRDLAQYCCTRVNTKLHFTHTHAPALEVNLNAKDRLSG